MLMVLCKRSWTYDRAPFAFFAGVYIDNRYDTCCPSLNCDGGSLVEFKGENVIVVGESNAELKNKLAPAGHNRAVGSPVEMFPRYSVVLFMQADYILLSDCVPLCIGDHTVKILVSMSACL